MPLHHQPDPLALLYQRLRPLMNRFLRLSMRKDWLERVPEAERVGFLAEIHEGQNALDMEIGMLEDKIRELTFNQTRPTPSDG